MKVGLAIGGPLALVAEAAKSCESNGIESLWVAETARTAFVQATVALNATQKATVGTSIALAFPRSPVITAMTARDLAELSDNRFILGLGTQVKRVNQFRYSTDFEHPAAKMREVIEVCRTVWRAYGGEPIDHRGRFYTVTMQPFPGAGPPTRPIPIYLAAVNTGMVRLTGEMADGLLGHPLSSPKYFSEVVRPALDEGLALSGRKADEVKIVAGVICSVNDDAEQALQDAKLQIAFYATTRTYKPILDTHGWGDVVDPLREAHAKGDFGAMIACITDEMAETYAVAGTAKDVKEKIKRWEGLADEVYLGPPWVAPDLSRTADTYLRMLDAFRA
jgi:probable F420-dependent oxidoreductase